MFPAFNLSGVIPPFTSSPTAGSNQSPYKTNLCTILAQLGSSPARKTLLQGLLHYRQAMRNIGITSGFQIINGSFTEDCETLRGRAPGDIDLVSFAYLPVPPPEVPNFVALNNALFDIAQVKATYGCDAYFVDLAKDSRLVVADTFYWYGLFSHQKITSTWKGLLQIPLIADDLAAQNILTPPPPVPPLVASLNLGGGNGP